MQPRPLEFFKQFIGKRIKYKPWDGCLVGNEWGYGNKPKKAKAFVRIKRVWSNPDKKSCLNGEDVIVAFRYYFPWQRKYEIVISHSINFEWSCPGSPIGSGL